MWGKKEHMASGMDMMMNEKMMDMMSKGDMMMIAGMKMDEKIAMLELKLDYLKKMRDIVKK